MNQFDRDPGIVPEAPPADAPPEPARPGPFHHGLVSRLRNYSLTVLILVAPAYITISLTWWFINWVDDLVRPFIPLAYLPETYLPVKIPGLGLIIVFVTLTLLVFLSNSASADIAAHLPDTEHVAAFMPCTPNPTTGFFFYVARRDIIDLDITVESAMTLLMSAGMVQPGDQQKKLAALAEAARVARATQPNRTAAPAK